ncbi:MAG: glucose-6-phosphate isomerase [Clostridia bacterium]|nr:glucose-6-phosphate isomerase [Clostridia bacterium]
MAIKLSTEFAEPFYTQAEYDALIPDAKRGMEEVLTHFEKGEDPLGWFSLPEDYDRAEFARIEEAAKKIRETCQVFVVIGIGGSYLGARAAIEFCQGPFHNQLRKDGPEIYFAGTSVDGDALTELVRLCEGRDVCINVISKSGTTTEPAIAFRVFREMLEKKYGEEGAKDRIFVTTDKNVKPGTLKELAVKEGYESFVVPGNIGGRYSVLTAVGLLPIAVSGADIRAMMGGAAAARRAFRGEFEENVCMQYALLRNLFYRKGKKFELYASYTPAMELTGEWLKQLYGESEGKDGKGLFPVSAIYSRDLHSLGQYVQEGERTMFETILLFDKPRYTFDIPKADTDVDGLRYLEGRDMAFVNQNAFRGTALAHRDGGVPGLVLTLDREDEENFGYMVYFFELACAVSGYMLGVDPFNQPGVEAYKKNMFRLLGKPGYTN